MCACMCVYMYIAMCVSMCVWVYVYSYVCVCVMCVYVSICSYVHINRYSTFIVNLPSLLTISTVIFIVCICSSLIAFEDPEHSDRRKSELISTTTYNVFVCVCHMQLCICVYVRAYICVYACVLLWVDGWAGGCGL